MKEKQRKTDTSHLVSELHSLLELENILVSKIDFTQESASFIPDVYDADIRSTVPDVNIMESGVQIRVGFELVGTHEEKQVFIGHFHFLVILNADEIDKVESLLEQDEVRAQFVQDQISRMVWPYLRRLVQQVLTDAGFEAFVLPLYK
jgi:preprotein translocase subunit SecB